MPLEETVTVKRQVPDHIAELVHFVHFLGRKGKITLYGTTDELIALAREFYEQEHGED